MRFPLRQTRIASATGPGRNDPCPCGSGRKYKHCCAGKTSGVAAPVGPSAGPAGQAELEQIRSLRDAGRFLEALRLAQAYTGRNPLDAAGHSELGMVHLYAGRAADAAPCLLQAVRLAPSVAAHHHNLGFALEYLGRDSEAIEAFRRATVLDPHHAEALERLGILLLNVGRRSEAIDCFRGVAALEPNTILGRLNHAKVLMEEEKRAEALEYLQQTIVLHPDRTRGETLSGHDPA